LQLVVEPGALADRGTMTDQHLQRQALPRPSRRRQALTSEDLLGGHESVEAIRLAGSLLSPLRAFDLEHFDLFGLQVLA
jgi:hypothetical protein